MHKYVREKSECFNTFFWEQTRIFKIKKKEMSQYTNMYSGYLKEINLSWKCGQRNKTPKRANSERWNLADLKILSNTYIQSRGY